MGKAFYIDTTRDALLRQKGARVESKYAVSVVIPAYNEKSRIKRAVLVTQSILANAKLVGEIVIAEDGSNDGTQETALEIAGADSHIHLISSSERLGRGRALNRAIKSCLGDVVCYIDADLATDMTYLPKIINAVANEGYDIAIGSRLMAESRAKRNSGRLLASLVYNRMVQIVLGSMVHDHQCGFKAFRRDKIACLLDEVKDNHWFWDTEVLVRGQRLGYRIKEIPVEWNESESTKVNVVKDANDMGRQIFRLWWDLKGTGAKSTEAK